MGQRVPRVICGAECMQGLDSPMAHMIIEGVARVRSALKKPGQWTSDVSHLESAEFATIDIHAELLLRWWCMQNAKWPWTMRWLTTLTHKKIYRKNSMIATFCLSSYQKLPGQFLVRCSAFFWLSLINIDWPSRPIIKPFKSSLSSIMKERVK